MFAPVLSTWVDVTPAAILYLRRYPEEAVQDWFVANVAMIDIEVGDNDIVPFRYRMDGLRDVVRAAQPDMGGEEVEKLVEKLLEAGVNIDPLVKQYGLDRHGAWFNVLV